MERLQEYIISVLTAAIIAGISTKLVKKPDTAAAVVRLVTMLFVTLVVASPLVDIHITDISSYIDSMRTDSLTVVNQGQDMAKEASAEIIIEKTEAYIMDKAGTYGANITADISISDYEELIPDRVVIEGNVSPYAKNMLKQMIEEDLGISRENQIWK